MVARVLQWRLTVTQLSPVDLAAVITFERNSFGNTMGDMITPVEILQNLAGPVSASNTIQSS